MREILAITMYYAKQCNVLFEKKKSIDQSVLINRSKVVLVSHIQTVHYKSNSALELRKVHPITVIIHFVLSCQCFLFEDYINRY